MPALFVFLLKVNIALLLFCAGYYLVLRHLTFYTLNRIYLVGAILFASVYPEINLDGFAQRHQHLAKPVQVVVFNLEAPAQTLVKPLVQPGYWFWIAVVFWLGASVLALRLMMQLCSLYKIHTNSIPMKIREHEVRVIHGDSGPFSFWRSIYVNPANHNASDLKSILLHEQVHVSEWHTLDILLAEISTIFYWFNPGIWLMKKAVRENIEFITDRKILNNGMDSKQYQYSLVNASFSASPQNIVNHFNLSTIKKRIIMMNAKRSSKFNLTRYAFLVPVVLICLLTFSFSKAELIKKSKIAYKDLSKSVASVARINMVKSVNHKVSRMGSALISMIKPAADRALPKDTATIANWGKGVPVTSPYAFSDTNKKHHDTIRVFKGVNYTLSIDSNKKVTIKTTYDPVMEPTTYVVNGKIVSAGDVGAMNPTSIAGLSIATSPKGSAIVNINTVHGIKPLAITSVRINGKPAAMANGKLINGTVAIIDTVKEGNKPKIVNGHMIIDTVFFGHPNQSRVHVFSHMPPGIDATRSNNTLAAANFTSPLRSVFSTNGLSIGNSSSINHLSDKLIVIDGKVASESDMKKLPAFDIERMVLKTDEETKSLYGDKAKNGIVFIVTKKGK